MVTNFVCESDLYQSLVENDIVSRVATFILNICILFSANHDLRFIETPYCWLYYYIFSLVATYKYLMNCKKYDIFNYVELYKKELGVKADNLVNIVDEDIKEHFEAKYPGITFSWSKILYKSKSNTQKN